MMSLPGVRSMIDTLCPAGQFFENCKLADLALRFRGSTIRPSPVEIMVSTPDPRR